VAANLVGGYLIGIAVASFQAMPQLDPVWRLALITGFLGGLTTFSSFSAEVVAMLMQGRLGLALGTAMLHVAGSLALTWLGIRTVQHFMA
jgi:CrcB protein